MCETPRKVYITCKEEKEKSKKEKKKKKTQRLSSICLNEYLDFYCF